jgi:hypothetical protein
MWPRESLWPRPSALAEQRPNCCLQTFLLAFIVLQLAVVAPVADLSLPPPVQVVQAEAEWRRRHAALGEERAAQQAQLEELRTAMAALAKTAEEAQRGQLHWVRRAREARTLWPQTWVG